MQRAAFPSSVLVVDDEPVVLDLFQRVLGEKGFSIRTAKNADEALALIEREDFGCLLTDKNLPGLDGIEIVRRVRLAQPFCACIVMTGYASTGSAVEALRLGAMDYLEKPFDDLARVADRIDEAVRQMRLEYERANDAPPGVAVRQAELDGATADLRTRSLHLLSRLVASKAAGREVLLSGESLLDDLRRLRESGRADPDELRLLEQRIEEHLSLARLAQTR
jgi:DNA-binding NtrC family response regulator